MNNQNNKAINTNKNKTMKANDPRSQANKMNMEIDQVSKTTEDNKQITTMYSQELNKDWGLVKRIAQKDMYKAVVENRRALFNATAEHRV